MDIKEYKQKLQELHDEYFGKNIGGGMNLHLLK